MYTAVVLDNVSKAKLLRELIYRIPKDWKIYAHHMTINMGPLHKGPAANDYTVGDEVSMDVVSFAQNDLVLAVKVESDIPSKNDIKHITVAVNVDDGGKPRMSNDLTEWQPIDRALVLFGKVEEVR
jgi:hypothetical protein